MMFLLCSHQDGPGDEKEENERNGQSDGSNHDRHHIAQRP